MYAEYILAKVSLENWKKKGEEDTSYFVYSFMDVTFRLSGGVLMGYPFSKIKIIIGW